MRRLSLLLAVLLAFGPVACDSDTATSTSTSESAIASIPPSTSTSVGAPPTVTTQPPSTTSGAVSTESTQPSGPIIVIYDDDGSPDGTVALLYLLVHPNVRVISVNLTYGEVYPEIYIQHLARLMDANGIEGIPLGYGEIPESDGAIHFPERLREASNDFWGMPIPNPDVTYAALPAGRQIVDAINGSPDPVRVFVTGPSTNLAEALRIDPDIRGNIAAIHMMGGAVYTPGNISDFFPDDPNVYAEWNMVADPASAREVFEAGIPIHLVPLDATNQVLVTKEDTRVWRSGGGLAGFGADLYDWLIDVFGQGNAAVWDLMTAAIMVDPSLCDFTRLNLAVVTRAGDTLGQTAVVAGAAPNVDVCLVPDAGAIREHLKDVFSAST